MNERLQELARQAGFFANPDVEKFEKFAELIVRECADLFEVEYGKSEVSGDEVARVLKQHFGVKE